MTIVVTTYLETNRGTNFKEFSKGFREPDQKRTISVPNEKFCSSYFQNLGLPLIKVAVKIFLPQQDDQ